MATPPRRPIVFLVASIFELPEPVTRHPVARLILFAI
jgi:hypothetical protein